MSEPDMRAVRSVVMAADVARIRADNPGPLTLDGTNTWVAGRSPCFVVDPGPALDDHLDAVAAEVAARGGAAVIALTHGHHDHSDGVPGLVERLGGDVEVVAAAFPGTRPPSAGDPFSVVPTPGHAEDHLAFVWEDVAFCGDAVLGQGSVFIAPGPGSLSGYLEALGRLRALSLSQLLCGHGPVVEDPAAKLEEYVAHRLDRERRLVAALDDGLRGLDEILDRVWSDVPEALRPAAAVTLLAHLDRLEEQGRDVSGVERPTWWPPPPGSFQV